MYKRMRNFLLVVAVVALMIGSLVTTAINRYMLVQFSREYKSIKEEQISYFFEESYKDLEDLVFSHAVWTDTLEAIEIGDFDWLYDNATGYIVDDESLNIDFIFIRNEGGMHQKAYGDLQLDIENTQVFDATLNHNETMREISWYGDIPILLYGSPILDNEEARPNGNFIIGRIIADDELGYLENLLSSRYVVSMAFTTERETGTDLSFETVELVHPLDKDNEIYMVAKFSIHYFSYIYNVSVGIIILVLLLVAGVAVTILTHNIKRLSKKIVQVIEVVKDISKGDYHIKLANKKYKMMPEINELVESINIMSGDIEDHIAQIEEHAKVIDQQYFSMIELLVDSVEMNDSYTYHHSVSVAKYAVLIGEAIGYEHMRDLELAAKLHDVGKISISTELLNKPGKLNDEEYEIIKMHSENGYKLLNKVEKFEIAKAGVLYHHEYYNGKGYPKGLKGDEIPLIAQIIAVADVYDAVTSDRAYRKAMTHEEAVRILNEEKGKALNPELVETFMEKLSRVET